MIFHIFICRMAVTRKRSYKSTINRVFVRKGCMITLHSFYFILFQPKMCCLSLAETTIIKMKTRKRSISFQIGHKKQSSVTNFERNSLMEGVALSFLGTRNTDQCTKKRYCITLIQARKDRSLCIDPNQKVKHPTLTHRPP